MKRWAVFSLLHVLTACQPATATPTASPLPPVTTPTEVVQPQETQQAETNNTINEIVLEGGACCISAQAGESLTLHIDLSSFEAQEQAKDMFLISIYEPHNDPWDRADIWRVSWPGEWQTFAPSAEMSFEVLPNWNTIRICASVNRIEKFSGDDDCATIAVYGEPQGENPGMTEFEPDKFVRDTRLDLPDWLSNPQIHVFSLLWMQLDDRFVITFFNAETQERFDLVVSDTAGYFWSPDGEEFGLLQQYSSHVHMIDLSTGIVSSDKIYRDAIKPLLYDERSLIGFRAFPNPVPVPLFANRTDPTYPDFQLSIDETYWDSLYEFSRSHWDDGNWRQVVRLINRQTGEERWLTEPQYDAKARSSDFSAVNNQVIVVEGQTNEDGEPTGDRLLIYEAETGALQAQYKGAFNGISWSPDGQQILYTTYQEGVAPPNVRTPCILTVATGNTRCFADIADHFEGKEDLFIANYRWSDNADRLFFIYRIPIYEPSTGLNSGIGNYCYYHLADGEVQCPDEAVFEEQHQTIQFYTVSPDEQYISVDHSRCLTGSGYCFTQVAVFGIENDVYIDLGYEKSISVRLHDHGFAPRTSFNLSHTSLLWRPAIQP
ncbi:MAG: hypothetical protein DWQ07_21760 [Chloroflexi bacterium]|nr:MAG: hypothetical protein DWQ07_21760 [Chloroflexota bacterium]MBL1197322.1 hypothetical protein [Chloroflexota bacterium]NOH14618.1 hypothetical protein [Chloroflexota bacterium]